MYWVHQSKVWADAQREGAGNRFEPVHAKRMADLEAEHPAIVERIRRDGAAAVLANARDRVLREHPDTARLHHCPKCGSLLRTPVARQCLECGHDWH